MEIKNIGKKSGGAKKRNVVKTGLVLLAVVAVAYFCKGFLAQAVSGSGGEAELGAPQAATVRVQEAEVGDITVSREYIGVVEAMQTVSLRPEVSAKIERVHFKEGADVKAGDILFTLDDKPFRATVDLRKAELAKAEANLDKAQKYYDRLKAADKRSVSASDIDAAYNEILQEKAAIGQAKASLQLAQIDLDNTKIAAPIPGKIGRTDFTKGNYVTPAGEVLATIVQSDPVRVSFSLPDHEYLEELDAFADLHKNVYHAALRLANDEEYPFFGARDFEDNTMDADSGTITVRLRFQNDRQALVPGSMVRVSLSPTEIKKGVLVPQEAILSDREGDYVYIVDAGGIARKRGVALGAEVNAMREIASGLEAGETVVVQGMQSLKPDMNVQIVENSMTGGDMSNTQALLFDPQGE